ncbi:hypothetical protein GCM10020229_47380 [Kitasatospora albolonga]
MTYNATSAPTFKNQIANSTSIWNSSVTKVQLRAVTGTRDFKYYEGNDSRGSYASTNGHGSGYIFLDYRQNQQYNSTRVTAHETGHVLGLPDHYSGPCSELMSGGGPGTSCTNPYPNAPAEKSRVNQLWANGLAAFNAQQAAKAARGELVVDVRGPGLRAVRPGPRHARAQLREASSSATSSARWAECRASRSSWSASRSRSAAGRWARALRRRSRPWSIGAPGPAPPDRR